MISSRKVHFVQLFFIALVFMVAINFIRASAASMLYVSQGGNDGYDCLSPTTACATIPGALNKAASGDTVNVTGVTYTGTGDQVLLVNKDVQLSGGWDTSFTNRTGFTIINGENLRRTLWVSPEYTASFEYFVFQNGFQNDNGAGGIFNFGILTLSHCIVENNHGTGFGGGISNYGPLTILWTTIRNNYGGGIYNSLNGSGPLVIQNSIINNNSNGSGVLISHQEASIENTTISGNDSGYDNGGGIYYFVGNENQNLTLKNVTITGNQANQWGGGVYVYINGGGKVFMSNTIISGNSSNLGSDCLGDIFSQGYNIVGDTTGCSFHSTIGDQLNVDPKLGTLQDNGGLTFSHWLYAGSPAIDGGNPSGCTDHLGNILTIDQRGFTRPLDGNSDGSNFCDIGAYEADPNNLPPIPPDSLWYVTPYGNDSNDCHNPTTTCATINGAIGKASSGDTVFVSSGVYLSTAANEVVFIDKNINLIGGWNSDFTTQDGFTTIDGRFTRRGITVIEQTTVRIDRFNIQNGLSPYADIIGYGGGGIYIGYRSKVTLSNSVIQGCTAGTNDPSHLSSPDGGGIGMNNYGSLTLNNCMVIRNTAYAAGGGIYSGGSTLTLNDSIVDGNIAGKGGGISGGYSGFITLNHSFVTNNTGTSRSDGGGGINSFNNTLTLISSSVTGNTTAGEGGGIVSNSMTISNSIISHNAAMIGGGLSTWFGDIDIRNSAILHNAATYGGGGGIYGRGDLVIVNSTIAHNKAHDPSVYAANGGGIFRAGGYIQASNVTIVRNYAEDVGGGIWMQGGFVTFRNSILAQNQAANSPDCTGTITSAGYNIIGDLTGCSFDSDSTDLTNINPRIAFIYGFPGILALWADSPAIDGGNPSGCTDHQSNPILIDQIGTARPLDGNGDSISVCDIGAYEYDPAHPPQWLFLSLITK